MATMSLEASEGNPMLRVAETDAQRDLAAWLLELPEDQEISLKDLKDKFNPEPLREQALIEACNHFQASHFLVMLARNGEVFWVKRDLEEAKMLEGANQENMLVFQEVRKAGNKGIYKKDLKRSTGLPQGALTRSLRWLENRKLVKAVKTIASKTMNLYVTHDITPLREHTGGPWYEDQEFDSDFVNFVQQTLIILIERGASGDGETLRSMHETILASGATKQELELPDLRSVLQTLFWDGRIELHRKETRPLNEFTIDTIRWQIPPPVRANQFTTESPCGGCPVRDKCTPYGGVVSPLLCKYMDTWNGSDGVLF
ncbi:DNA-directed RNA polymerase III subunit RPC6 [Hondaea fermentalgiana]|uniref:DNA-directed RNA polymerase III subunit RPC6 n=1 Tax=Hondaea fermentalgiana TaxID=2315210 RepID=A0A2R5GCR3_9STRA|nr:DNA-directed RNA polymerase III subunit RPC6 [Hondaea fermentalgiana]|eukprot:GBG27488.1 DNA-directed RNA polymerase III subunit RPC6 [Hondaea fermentalgiana]